MKNQEIKKPDMAFMIIHVIFIVIMLVLGTILSINAGKIVTLHNLYSKGNYVEESATIVKYKEIVHRGNYIDYDTYYEYISPDGTVYTGIHEMRIKTEEEAKAQIGKKIKIYVDHELKLQKKDYPIGAAWFNGIASVVCFGIFFNSFIRVIIFIKRWRRYKQFQKDSTTKEGIK